MAVFVKLVKHDDPSPGRQDLGAGIARNRCGPLENDISVVVIVPIEVGTGDAPAGVSFAHLSRTRDERHLPLAAEVRSKDGCIESLALLHADKHSVLSGMVKTFPQKAAVWSGFARTACSTDAVMPALHVIDTVIVRWHGPQLKEPHRVGCVSDLPITLEKVRAFLDGKREGTRRARTVMLEQAQSDAHAIIELEKVDTETALKRSFCGYHISWRTSCLRTPGTLTGCPARGKGVS